MNLWSIVALLFAAEIGSILGIYGLVTTNVPFFMNTMTLLRKNLLRHILRRPGASALPDSPGEAISRFRGDVFEIPLFALWLNDIMGMIAFNIIALIVMVQHQPDLHRAGAAAADRGGGDRRGLDQAHRRIPPRQQPRHRDHHRLYRRILRRGAGGQGGHRRRGRDRAFQEAERRAAQCWRCATACSTKS